MTILATFLVPECIIMGADSYATATIDGYNTSTEYSDKLCFSEEKNIGVSFCGDLMFGSSKVSEIIQNIMNSNEVSNCYDVATKLKDLLKATGADTQFHICGYIDNRKYMYYLDKHDMTLCTPNNLNEDVNRLYWAGQIEYISKLLGDKEGQVLFENTAGIKDAIDLVKFVIDTTCKCCRFTAGLTLCGGPIDILLMMPTGSKWISHKY